MSNRKKIDISFRTIYDVGPDGVYFEWQVKNPLLKRKNRTSERHGPYPTIEIARKAFEEIGLKFAKEIMGKKDE